MKKKKSIFSSVIALVILALAVLFGSDNSSSTAEAPSAESRDSGQAVQKEREAETGDIREDGEYTGKEQVALYIHTFGKLPSNYITKKEAQKLGWRSSEGNLKDVAPGKSIGGDYFGNYDGDLPVKSGREYHECDIDSDGGFRNAKRIIYSSDGLVFYTEDHYKTFEQLY